MMFIPLLSAFTFLGFSQVASGATCEIPKGEVSLTITYSTTSLSGTTSTRYIVPLNVFSKILMDIAGNVTSEKPSNAKDLQSNVTELQGLIPKLAADPSNTDNVKLFSKYLLNLLRGLRTAGSSKLMTLFMQLTDKFSCDPATTTAKPQSTTVSPGSSDKPAVATLIDQLVALVNSLTPDGADSTVAGIISDLQKQIKALPDATDIFDAVLKIIMGLLDLYMNADSTLQDELKPILGLATQILGSLPSAQKIFSGLPAYLVNVLTNLGLSNPTGDCGLSKVLDVLKTLLGSGKSTLSTLVAALNALIDCLTKNLPDALKSIVKTLMDQLTQFAKGNLTPQSIFETLVKIVDAALKDPSSLNAVKSVIPVILGAIGLLFSSIPNISQAIQALLNKLNLPTNTGGTGCSGLLPGLLCLVSGLVNGLVGSGDGIKQLASTVGNLTTVNLSNLGNLGNLNLSTALDLKALGLDGTVSANANTGKSSSGNLVGDLVNGLLNLLG